jgi:tetratricopeptide (TPR) repeat protein
MPELRDGDSLRRQAVRIQPWARWIAGFLGAAGVGSGGAAVFLTHVEAGPVALIAGGVLFLFLALGGVMPTRLKIGDNEAEWQELAESVANIQRQVPEVGALLDSGGVSLSAILSGQILSSNPSLARAGAKVGALAEDVRLLEAKAGQDLVPPDALLEIGRWYLAQQDWATGARYLDEYVKRVEADWETYFILGTAYANSRQGEQSDRAALRAYDEAVMRWPSDPPGGMTARLYSHRSAMKKRLGRLREAEADAEIALRLAKAEVAETDYEYVDAIYNLACIEAMLGNRDSALHHVAELSRLGATYRIPAHLDDYFSTLRDDPKFLELVEAGQSRLRSRNRPGG